MWLALRGCWDGECEREFEGTGECGEVCGVEFEGTGNEVRSLRVLGSVVKS